MGEGEYPTKGTGASPPSSITLRPFNGGVEVIIGRERLEFPSVISAGLMWAVPWVGSDNHRSLLKYASHHKHFSI